MKDHLAAAAIGRAKAALDVIDVAVSGGRPRIEDDPARGFRSFGDFARVVRSEGTNFANPSDERLRIGAAVPTTFGSELSGVDAGFAVPAQFANEIWTYAGTEDALLPFTDNVSVTSNSMIFPKDETTPWGTDGPRAYWQAEAAAGTQTKPKLGTATLRLLKLMAFVPITDELASDAPAMATYLPRRVGAHIRWRANEAILFGTGNGTPLGALVGGAAITVAKESGQATATFDPNNFRKMVGRMPPGSYSRAVWLLGPDTLAPLLGVNFGSFFLDDIDADDELPPGLAGPVFKMLGRPVYESQHTSPFSSQGDVTLVDLSYYTTISPGAGIDVATSMHLWFDLDVEAYRITFRMDGRPKIVAPLVQAKGSNTLSPFVQLGAR